MPRNPLETFELKLSYLMPIFLILGALINLDITSSPTLPLHGFAQVQVRPASFADYNQDPAGLIFPAIDPEIIQDVNNDSINLGLGSQSQGNEVATLPAGQTSTSPAGPSSTPTNPAPTSTNTPPLPSFTLPPLPTFTPPPFPTFTPLSPPTIELPPPLDFIPSLIPTICILFICN